MQNLNVKYSGYYLENLFLMIDNYNKKYPKVLIVNGEPINSLTATGITMKNLFHNWPKECLAQIHTHAISIEGSFTFSDMVTLLDLNIPKILKKFIIRQKNEFKNVDLSQEFTISKISEIQVKRGIVFLKKIIRGDIYTLLNLLPLKIHVDLYDSCDKFKPDVIYSMLGSIEVMKLALHLSIRLNVPIVPHFMDDWPSTISRNSTFYPLFFPVQRYLLHKIINNAPLVLSICDAMSHEYKRRYNKEVHAFMNCVDFTLFSEQSNKDDECECIRFGYIGGLHLNRWKSLKDIAISLQEIRNVGINVELVVYAPSGDLDKYGFILSEMQVVKIGGTLNSDEVSDYLQKFDVLIHIESFDEFDRLYTKFSISTKIPQYMASGKPIFAYGPDEVASCRYIRDNDCGVIVGERKSNILIEELRILALDKKFRDRLGYNGRSVALANHNADTERERFRLLLKKSITLLPPRS